MNVFDFVILAVVIVAVGFAIRRVILNKKQGKSCGGNCAGKTNGHCGIKTFSGKKSAKTAFFIVFHFNFFIILLSFNIFFFIC